MTAPNLLNLTSITGKTIAYNGTTSTVNMITNPANSNKLIKINAIIVTNVDGTNDATVRVGITTPNTQAFLAHDLNIPALTTLVLIDKSSSFYLEESEILYGSASANLDLNIAISYEELA